MSENLIPNGIHEKLPIRDYHADPALSKSGMARFAQLPAMYLSSEEDKPCFAFGSAAHMLTLEEERFDAEVICYPDRRAGKEWERFRIENGYKIILYPAEFRDIHNIRKSLWQYRTFRELMSGVLVEQSAFWEQDGLRMKARPDMQQPQKRRLSDLKTCQGLTDHSLSKEIYNRRYHWQAYQCLTGFNAAQEDVAYREFVFVFVSKKPYDPERGIHGVRFIKMDMRADPWMELAESEIKPLLERFKECKRTGKFPGYPDTIEAIAPPAWTAGEAEDLHLTFEGEEVDV